MDDFIFAKIYTYRLMHAKTTALLDWDAKATKL